MSDDEEQPTLEELREYYKQHRDSEKLKKMHEIYEQNPHAEAPLPPQMSNPALNDRPIDPITHQPLTYEQMKQRFLTLQGRSKGWQVADDNIDHDITTPRPSEGKPEKSYEQMRQEWFALQGRSDPAKKTTEWQDRLKKDQQRSGSV